MTKLITVQGADLGPYAKKIIRTPGIPDYAARFIASHIKAPAGTVLTEWQSVMGTRPTVLKNSAPATIASTVTLRMDGGRPAVHSPGDATNGGRLLGPHIGTRPSTFAGVFKADKGATALAGANGMQFLRNESGNHNANGGAYTAVSRDGWVFMLMTVAADGAFTLRVNDHEVSKPAPGLSIPANYAGIYFGASAAKAALTREMVFWDQGMNLTEREAIHAYYRTQYPEIAL